jgi:hypothetical protein
MSEPQLPPETHLGEDVYVSYRGRQIWLRERSDDGDDMVALGHEQWLALLAFVEKIAADIRGNGADEAGDAVPTPDA